MLKSYKVLTNIATDVHMPFPCSVYFQSSVCRLIIELSLTTPVRFMMKTVLSADHCIIDLTIVVFWYVTLFLGE